MNKELLEVNMENYIICIYDGNLVKVPYDDAMSGRYPEYDKAIIVKNNCKLEYSNYGLLVVDGCYYTVVEDSWDGFQDANFDEEDTAKIMILFLKELIDK